MRHLRGLGPVVRAYERGIARQLIPDVYYRQDDSLGLAYGLLPLTNGGETIAASHEQALAVDRNWPNMIGGREHSCPARARASLRRSLIAGREDGKRRGARPADYG
jgi:hypothetical protein